MNLVVFDLDGTLAMTNRVDGECYERALDEALRISGLDTNWTRYDHVTDHFMNLLRQRCDIDVQQCMEVPGAGETLTQLKTGDEWGVALATGAWQDFKDASVFLSCLESASPPENL